MKLKLPANVYSPQDLDGLLMEIREYARWYSHEAVKKKATAKPSQPPSVSSDTREVIREWHGGKESTAKTLDKLIAAVEDLRDTAPTIAITLAAPAGPKLKAQLTDWCRQHLRADILVDFSFDGSLLGGMVVRWGSHIYDWSFRRQILQSRHQFPEVLRRV